MLARGVFSFHPPSTSTSCQNSLSPIIPAHARFSRKSNHSRTYGPPGGGDIPIFWSDQFFGTFSQKSPTVPAFISATCALFHFPYHTYPLFFQHLPHSCPKNRGCNPPCPTNRNPVLRVPVSPGHSPPFTSHSQTCYRAFTHPSPSLVTIRRSQGSDTNTMPTVNTRPTVHFYRCDPPREILS
jgi:hypothetical protein